MGEIKFRAWDRRSKIMLQDVTIEPFRIWGETNQDALTEDCDFMQYTGVKDKNGVDIYEDDIVKFEDMLFKVDFVDGYNSDYYNSFPKCAFYGLVPLKQNKEEPLIQIMEFQFDDEYRYEVIGNIFEDLELLERENK